MNLVHAAAHIGLETLPQGFDLAFIAVVILVGPIAAAVSLGFRRAIAAGLLVTFMAASLGYGVYNHFIGSGPDHVSIVPGELWTLVFVVSGAVLAGLELAGACIAGLVLERSARIPSGPVAPPA